MSVLMIVVLGATLTALTSFERSTSTNQRQNVAQDQVRNALDLATRDLRNLASPTVNLPQAVDRADPQDVIFQSEGHIKPSGSLNQTNTTRALLPRPLTESLPADGRAPRRRRSPRTRYAPDRAGRRPRSWPRTS